MAIIRVAQRSGHQAQVYLFLQGEQQHLYTVEPCIIGPHLAVGVSGGIKTL